MIWTTIGSLLEYFILPYDIIHLKIYFVSIYKASIELSFIIWTIKSSLHFCEYFHNTIYFISFYKTNKGLILFNNPAETFDFYNIPTNKLLFLHRASMIDDKRYTDCYF